MAEISDSPNMSLLSPLQPGRGKERFTHHFSCRAQCILGVEKGWRSVVPIAVETTKMQLQFCKQDPGGGSAMAQL